MLLDKTNSDSFSVWSSAENNVYVNIDTSANNKGKVTHTRIYQYFGPTIQLDEMSMFLDDKSASMAKSISDNDIDIPTGHIDSSTAQKVLGSTQSIDSSVNNINSRNYTTLGNNANDRIYSIGKSFPLIRINDRYFSYECIEKFVLDSTDFIPTILLVLNTHDSEMIKLNLIKDGDICSVFINQGHGMLKSYRGDFLITYSYVAGKKSSNLNAKTRLYIEGELYVPLLYDSTLTFSVAGTSKTALIEAAKTLGLGFNFCDEQDTNDTLMWYCTSDGDLIENSNDAPILKFLKNTAAHAYSKFEDFYDCWIDIRYGLSFLNIAKMLGGSGLDERIDLAFFNSAMSNHSGRDGENVNPSNETTKNNPRLQPKLLTNMFTDEQATTAFAILEVEEINNSGNVTKALGLSYKTATNVTNPGLGSQGYDLVMNFSIPVNADKLSNGFYLLAGPGTNSTYKKGENGSYAAQHITMQGGVIADTLSDADGERIAETDSNMECSGATNKYYEAGAKHNRMNNVWLQKKMIKVKLNGCNLLIMRGEKIPTLVVDSPAGVNIFGANKDNIVSKRTIENFTGWFIIKGIKWIFDKSKDVNAGTMWTTEVTLTRREWPIIGYNKSILDGEISIVNHVDESTILEAKNNLTAALTSENSVDSSTDAYSETVATGLNSYMLTIYNDIKTAVANKNRSILLTSGKRWAIDSNGNKTDGSATVVENGLYKFVNAVGKECWFSNPTSPHVTGDAIDIINGMGTDFNSIIRIIANDLKTLADMLTNTVYCAIETGKDDMGQSVKHYHIGKKVDTDQTSCSQYSAWWDIVKDQLKSETFTVNNKTYNITETTEEALKQPVSQSVVTYVDSVDEVLPTDTEYSGTQTMSNLTVTDIGISNEMLNKICLLETGHSFGYMMEAKDLNGYDLHDANGHKTFGYGLLYHPTAGKYMDKVKSSYTQSELETLYKLTVKKTADVVKNFATKNNLNLSVNLIDAMTCAAYNFGNGFVTKYSISLKYIKSNPNNTAIKNIWAHLSDHQKSKYPGLVKRRDFEANWYFGIKS